MALENAPRRLAQGEWLALVGLFDPLTAVQARRLAGFRARGRNILTLVLEYPGALLSAEARAVLVAALRDVDLVSIASLETWKSALANSGAVEILEDLPGERARSAEFVRFVLDRQSAAPLAIGENKR